MSKAKLAGALGVADLLGADLRTPLPKKQAAGYASPELPPSPVRAPELELKEGVKSPKSRRAKVKSEAKEAEAKEAKEAKPEEAGKDVASRAEPEKPAGYPRRPLVSTSETSPNAQCTVAEGQASTEIRTKVFRIGAPLLRSTIPVTLGKSRDTKQTAASTGEKDGSDVETILSLSDAEAVDEGHLSVTLDFPC
ncbi:unnamed protein product [Effrenium voratum]|uniref:Uncharacterized protein n=1 Tax=Effrenium voratum TaxID=2562239 RepID=A0AA36MV38_9DINO|nr:unnamed protein product [Effrenium voratum]CAJ1417213.1 unnamed protein product [Effrenium voratum]